MGCFESFSKIVITMKTWLFGPFLHVGEFCPNGCFSGVLRVLAKSFITGYFWGVLRVLAKLS